MITKQDAQTTWLKVFSEKEAPNINFIANAIHEAALDGNTKVEILFKTLPNYPDYETSLMTQSFFEIKDFTTNLHGDAIEQNINRYYNKLTISWS